MFVAVIAVVVAVIAVVAAVIEIVFQTSDSVCDVIDLDGELVFGVSDEADANDFSFHFPPNLSLSLTIGKQPYLIGVFKCMHKLDLFTIEPHGDLLNPLKLQRFTRIFFIVYYTGRNT